MTKLISTTLVAGALAFAAAATPVLAADGPVKVVYHVNENNAQAMNALRNINNHLVADPTARIVVVAHSGGIQFLLDGAVDSNNAPFEAAVQTAKAKGVEFRLCEFTLKRNKIDPKRVIPEATLVPSGVAEVAKLQFKEGYAYLRP